MKTGIAISVMALAALAAGAALARDWDDGFVPLAPALQQPGHEEWTWNGGDSLALQAPAVMRYTPEGSPRIVITGPQDMLAHVRVGQGRIRMDDEWRSQWHDDARLQVTVTGVTVHNLALSGSGEARLEKLNLDHLNVSVSGSGSLTAEGRGDNLRLSLSGSGHADLSKLAAHDADITVSGSGTLAQGGHLDHVNLNVSGSGRVELGQMQMRQAMLHVSGNGQVATGGGMEQVELSLSGKGQVDLGAMQAHNAVIHMSGAGTVTGSGHSDRVDLTLSGSGKVELEKLETRQADIHVSGNGHVALTPREDANVSVAGSGVVTMASRPAHLSQSITGSGRVHINGD